MDPNVCPIVLNRIARSLLPWKGVLAVMSVTGSCDSVGPDANVEIEVSVSRATVPSGDSLRIRLVARNPTEDTIELASGPCGPLSYRVLDLEGIRIAPRPDQYCGFIGGSPSGVLRPSDSTRISHLWSALRNYGVAGVPESLPPGRYSVVGGLYGEPDLRFPTAPVFVNVIRP